MDSQISQITQIKNPKTYAIIGAPSLQFRRFVF